MPENKSDFRQQMARVETLVGAIERCPDPATRDAARELVRALLDLHAAGLEQMIELADAAGEPGQVLLERFARNPLVSNLLLLHSLHPDPIELRAAQALEKMRPRLHGLGGDADLLSCDPETVRVRLRGNASAAGELRSIVEAILTDAAPDVRGIQFEENWDRSAEGRIALPLSHS